MKKAALYTRVSTNYQVDKDSLPHQRHELINYAQYALQIDNYVVFEDAGFSGKNTDRPSYQDMMHRIRQGEFTHLVVDKIDRISRNLLDFAAMYEELKDLDVIFVSRNEQFDTSNAMGEAMLKIILVFAELERHITSERVTAIMLDRAEKGKWNGANVPLGYRWSDEAQFPVIDDAEATTVRFIFDQYLDRNSMLQIARNLNQNHIPTKRGGVWTAATVGQILANPFYKGTLRYNYRSAARGKIKKQEEWVVKDNNHPGIVSPAQWEQCQELCRTKSCQRDHQTRRHYAFGRLIYCTCGGRGTPQYDSKTRANGLNPTYYHCIKRWDGRTTSCDNNRSISDKILAVFVFSYMQNMIQIQQDIQSYSSIEHMEQKLLSGDAFASVVGINPASMQDIYDLFMQQNHVDYAAKSKKVSLDDSIQAKLIQERQAHERALERLSKAYLYMDMGMSEKSFLVERQRIEQEITKINTRLKKMVHVETKDVEFLEQASNFIIQKQLLSTETIDWDTFAINVPAKSINQFLKSVINRIVVYKQQVMAIEFKNGIVHQFLYP